MINDNSGFTVGGCSKRGVINAKSLIAFRKTNNTNFGNNASNNNNNKEDMQVHSGEISSHKVSINPTNYEFIDPTSQPDRDLDRLKFDVRKIENTPTVCFDRIIKTQKLQHNTSYFIYYSCMDYR